ncbi:gliding motility-associated C-terminal domain-containing protein [Hymenobacter sp. HSC-4F20]|uniref:T9SS type B sorting domain-containing protein n=1 Tax=Hymenobacter sp. HSC-4F20 TaxID=2864135 RepID=UPI001C72B8A1|nr:gliding motility-associated C-terminal domain-containing protein [Hymenobacter sp. HSC-4F20]MBX0293116.1 gliding motility-associated C-terminal domain-containing protein [Hymenobacter sp. HSC-4F20]
MTQRYFSFFFHHLFLLLRHGYLVAGLVSLPYLGAAQAPLTEWDRTIGGPTNDGIGIVRQTQDGGYFVAGGSDSPVGPFKSQPPRTTSDYWLLKLDEQGRYQWDRTLAGETNSLGGLAEAQPTADGGYIVGGESTSGVGGDRTAPSRGSYDYWLIKLDAQGQKVWDQAYGGDGPDYLRSMQQTADGGYILGGYSHSGVSGDKTEPSRGNTDFWIVKVDAQGTKQWDRTLGAKDLANPYIANHLSRVRQTSDGGYLVGGYTDGGLGGDKTGNSRGSTDFWIVKLNAQGSKQWDRTLGGAAVDMLQTLLATPDGGALLVGTSASPVSGEKTQPSRGTGDYWLVKVDAQGNKQWDRTYGGADYDDVTSVCAGADGGYLVGGFSWSGASGDKTQPNRGRLDEWLVKVDAQGNLEWDRTLGGPELDYIGEVQATADGGYILSGASQSGVSADKSEPNLGIPFYFDGWLIKLAAPVVRITGPTTLCPGSTLQLTASGTGRVVSYQWNTGATSATLTVTQPGTYAVTATFSGGRTHTATYQVLPFQGIARIVGDSVLCPGRSVALSVQAPGNVAIRWSTGASTPTLTVTQPGVYSVVATYPMGCTSTATVQVRAAPALPRLALGADTLVCAGQALTLFPSGGSLAAPYTYRWSTGATTPTLTVRESGSYSLTIQSACEVYSATRTVTFSPCLTIPNIITPNGDLFNERFVVQGLSGAGWMLEIYNRWGQQVYKTHDYHNEWGPGSTPGTYYYLLQHAATSTVRKGWLQVAP